MPPLSLSMQSAELAKWRVAVPFVAEIGSKPTWSTERAKRTWRKHTANVVSSCHFFTFGCCFDDLLFCPPKAWKWNQVWIVS